MATRWIDFSKYSSMRLGPRVEVALIEDDHVWSDHTLIGGANNLLISPTPPPLMILSKQYDFIDIQPDYFRVGAAVMAGRVLSAVKRENIGHFEYLSKLPGTLGGIIKMNAGLKEYEIFNYLIAIRTRQGWIPKEAIEHGYRFSAIDDVIFEATFERHEGFSYERLAMFDQMRTNQPKEPSAGSCFKNPPNHYAGALIEAVGLRGFRRGNMGFSQVHANFLVNYGEGSFEDAIHLIHEAQMRVWKHFHIRLECEVVIV